MNNHFFLLAAIFCWSLSLPGMGQEVILPPPAGQTDWKNPYPGLGNVSPGSIEPPAAFPPAITLYADSGNENSAELSPTMRSTELYLSRFPNNKRTGMFQKVNFNTLWTPASSGLGMTELDLSAMFALPMPTVDSPLLLTPKFATTFFDAKIQSETFYTTGLGLRWIRPIVKDKFTADLGFSLLYSGDFHVRAGDALRFPAHMAGVWNLNPRTKVVIGAIFSDRQDGYNWFPMAGLIWTPHDDISVELLIPRMRLAQRIRWFGSAAGDEQSDWLYTAFEFGSGSWGSEHAGGRVEYRDLRLLLGYERRTRFGLTLGLEVGCMFDRHMTHFGIEDPSESVFLRFRSSF